MFVAQMWQLFEFWKFKVCQQIVLDSLVNKKMKYNNVKILESSWSLFIDKQ